MPESIIKDLRVLVFKGGSDAPDQGVIRGNPCDPTGKQRRRESKPYVPFHSRVQIFSPVKIPIKVPVFQDTGIFI